MRVCALSLILMVYSFVLVLLTAMPMFCIWEEGLKFFNMKTALERNCANKNLEKIDNFYVCVFFNVRTGSRISCLFLNQKPLDPPSFLFPEEIESCVAVDITEPDIASAATLAAIDGELSRLRESRTTLNLDRPWMANLGSEN